MIAVDGILRFAIRTLCTSLLLLLAFAGESSATSCDPQLYYDHTRFAEWVVLGTVTEAKAVGERSVEFVIDDVDPVRGDPPATLRLHTDLGGYGPKISIGDRYVLFLNESDTYVGHCSGFQRYELQEYFHVLLMRGIGDCGTDYDREVAVAYARKEFLGEGAQYTRLIIDNLLNRFLEISPTLRIESTEDRLSVKGIDFVFADDALIAIETVRCVG